MARAYGTAREFLDDIVAVAHLTLTRSQSATDTASARALSATDIEVVTFREHIDARLAATGETERVPLEELARTFQLTVTERRCLGFLVAMEVSSDVRARVPGGAATLELLDRLIYDERVFRDQFAVELGARGRLWAYSLIEWANERADVGRLHRHVRVAPRVVELALGTRELADDVAAVANLDRSPSSGDDLLIAVGVRDMIVAALRGSTSSVPVIRGSEGSGRKSLALAAAHAIGAPALLVKCDDLPATPSLPSLFAAIEREALLFGAATVFLHSDALAALPDRGLPDRTKLLDRMFSAHPGPVIATASPHLAVPLFESRGTITVELGVPAESERAELWRRELGEDTELSSAAAARYRVTGGTIKRAARIARERSLVAKAPLALVDVQAGIRGAVENKLSSLGTLIEWKQSWDDLVLPDESRDELLEMISRVRHRRRVLDEWGFARKVAKGLGVPAMFHGPPGTGKTMAAGLVAAELGLDLYQIDLSRMVSKYIGETEKQLAQVFDAAEAGHAILLFDEADSLFAKRTDVKSSNDRYANLEVNYLLQRMEAFSGITILTTNLDSGIDDAFKRRLAFRIAFPLPEADERERLWQRMMPDAVRVAPDIDFKKLAERFEMSGGYIRNAALRAAYLAAADGDRIEMRHLVRAATLEYVSMGKVMTTSSLGVFGGGL
jgi:hypothetical protein